MRDLVYKFFHCVNGDLLNYKSYEFSDSSFTTATITDMVEQYWPNISGNTYGIVKYSNNSSIWIGTYIKYGNDDGAITINGISAYSPFQRGVLIKSVWKWDPIVANSDFKNAKTIGTYSEVGTYETEDVSKYNMLLFRIYVGSTYTFEFLPVFVIASSSGGGWRHHTENGRVTFRFETDTSFQVVDVTDPNFKNITVYGL